MRDLGIRDCRHGLPFVGREGRWGKKEKRKKEKEKRKEKKTKRQKEKRASKPRALNGKCKSRVHLSLDWRAPCEESR